MSTAADTVTRRRVFYVPGYDPFPPRRYRELYRREGKKQAQISDYSLQVTASPASGGSGWTVDTCIAGHNVRTEFEVLVWSDLVRESMTGRIAETYKRLFQTVWIYACSGAFWRLMKLRKGPVLAALYPVVMLVAQAVIAAGVAVGVMWALINGTAAFHPAAGAVATVLHWTGAGAAGGFAFLWVLEQFKRSDHIFYAHYLLNDFAYTAQSQGEFSPELRERISAYSNRVAEAITEDVDEVLVVGHSSGAHIGACILAAVLSERSMPSPGTRLGFLSLGHVVPMVSFLPKATQLRRSLHILSKSRACTWVDVTAPSDGCCFAMVDPVSVSGVAPEDKQGPLVVSAAFRKSLSPTTLKTLRWRFFRLHFQYLCAFDRPQNYDYFQVTAGPQSLSRRYKNRSASPSRIERPINKHVSRAA